LAHQREVVLSLCQQCRDADILYPPAIPSSRAGDTMEASAQKVSSLPAAASMPENTIEEINAKMLSVEAQIDSTSDAKRMKHLQEKETQLRETRKQLQEKENLLLQLQLQGATSGKFSILLGGGGGAKLVQA
jgi:predicted RNase H-like nuclease (RuvC/YqgF family)